MWGDGVAWMSGVGKYCGMKWDDVAWWGNV